MLDEMTLETRKEICLSVALISSKKKNLPLARDEAAEEAADATDERPVALGIAELLLSTTETEEGTALVAEAAAEEEASALAAEVVAALAEVVAALAEVVATLAELVAESPL